METWSQVIIEWVNCLELLDTSIRSLEELHDGKFYEKLISLLSCKSKDHLVNNEDFIYEFIREEYPNFLVGVHSSHTLEDISITSLLLLRTSQEHEFQRPMCLKLHLETQVKIKVFLEYVLRYGKDLTPDVLTTAISELSDDTPKTPPATPKVQPLKRFFDSPVARSARNNRLANEHIREIRRLESALESERFEKFDLQDELNAERKKVQNLERRYSDKSRELEVLREELRTKPMTPCSSTKKQNSRETLECYRKEIKSLEEYSASLRAEVEKLTDENENLTKNLASSTRQFSSLKEKLERTELLSETLSIRVELKERELSELELQNEELRNHLQEMRKASVGEQSFEVDSFAAGDSSLRLPNDGEALSSVIDIQLQEAREEARVLRARLEGTSRKLELVECVVLEYTNRIKSLEKNMVQVETENSHLKSNIEYATKTTKEFMNQIARLSLEHDLELKDLTIGELSSQFTDLISSLRSANDCKKIEIKELDVKLVEANTTISTLKDTICSMEKKNEENILEQAKLLKEIKTSDLKIKNFESAMLEYSARVNSLQEEVEELKNKNSSLNSDIQNIATDAKGFMIKIAQLSIKDPLDLNDCPPTELSIQFENLITSLESVNDSKEKQIKQLDIQLNEVNTTILMLNEKVNSMEKKDRENTSELTKMSDCLQDSTEKIKELEETVSQYTIERATNLKEFNIERESLRNYINELECDLHDRKSLIESLTSRVNDLKNEKDTMFEEFESSKRNFTQKLMDYQVQSSKSIQKLTEEYQILQKELEELNLDRKNLNTEITAKDENLRTAQQRNVELEILLSEKSEISNQLNMNMLSLQNKLEQSNVKIEQLESEKQSLEDRLKITNIETDKLIESLELRISGLSMDLSSLHEEKDSLNIQLNEVNTTILMLNEKVNSMEKKDRENTSELTKMSDCLQDSAEKIKELKETVSQYAIERATSLKEFNIERESLRNYVNELQCDLHDRNSLIESLTSRVNDLKNEKDTMFEESESSKRNFTQKLMEYQVQSSKSIQKLSEEYQILQKELEELNLDRKNLNTEITAKDENLRTVQQRNVDLEILISEKSEISNQLNMNMLSLQNKLEQSNVKIERLESEKKSLEDRLKITNIETDKLIESLKLRISGLSMDLSSLHEEKDSLNIQLNEVNTTILMLNEKVNSMEKKDRENTSELTKMSDCLQDSAEKIKELEETVSQYTIERATNLKEFNIERESLRNYINELECDLHDRKSLIESLTSRVNDLKNEKDTMFEESESSKRNFTQKLMEYQVQSSKSIQKLTEEYQILQKELDELNLDRKNLNTEITAKDENLKTVEQRNVELETLLSEKSEISNQLNMNMLSLQNKLEQSNVKIEQLESEKQSLEDRLKITNIETDELLESLKLRISELSMDLSSVHEEKDSLRRRLSIALEEIRSEGERNEALLSGREHHRIENERLLEQQRQRELQMKEIVLNLQEIRASRDAVLEARALALQESNDQLEELRKEFQVTKATLEDELQKEKLSKTEMERMYNDLRVKYTDLENKYIDLNNNRANLENKCGDLENSYRDLENECDVLRNDLSDTNNKCTQLKNKCSDMEKKCVDLENESSSLKKNCKEFETKCTNLENNCTDMENKYFDLDKKYTDLAKKCCDFQNRISDDTSKLKKLEDNLKNEKLELKTIKECCRNLIQRKESLWELISKVITLRNLLNIDVNSIKEYWIEVREKFQDFWTNDSSICDESKELRIKKEELQKKILDLNGGYLDCLLPVMDITWESFLWTEKILQTNFLVPRIDSGEDFDTKETQQEKNVDLENAKSILAVEMEKFNSVRNNVATIRKEIENFANSASSYETNLKIIQAKAKLKEKQVVDKSSKEKKELKEKLDLFRMRNTKLEKNLDDLRNEMKRFKTEKPSDEGQKELKDKIESLQGDIQRLQLERDELSKRPKEEDFDKRLKDVHEEYGQKLEKLKLKMKAAYNEQVEKLNRDQDKALQEKAESMQIKMTEQYQKHVEEIEKYKKHVTDMTNKYWDVSEKFLNEKHEKEAALKKLQECKTKSRADNFTQPYSYDKTGAIVQNRTSSLDRKDFANDSLEDSSRRVSRTIQVIQEETTYARRRSVRNIQAMGNAFNAEDEEGEIFDNTCLADMKQGRNPLMADPDRLSILQQRNALCKPHLKSSYPAETQFHSTIFSEDDIKHGLGADDVFNDSLSQSLLPGQKAKKRDRTQTSYKRPGPPTPSKNGGRLSLQGNELFSPKSRILRERNVERRMTTTPRTFKDLFSSSSSRRKDENVTGTPRARRLSIFRKN